jgi:O-antigen ligase
MTSLSHTYLPYPIATETKRIQRGLMFFFMFLSIGPLVTMMIEIADPRAKVFEVEAVGGINKRLGSRDGYLIGRSGATVAQLLEPTRAIVALFVISFVLHGIIRKSFGRFDRTELLMGAFSIILLASALFKSSVFAFSMRVVSDAFIVPFLAYFIARRLITDEHRYRRLIRSIAYMGVSVILISLIERIVHDGLFYRLNGPFTSGTALYMVLAVVFFILLSEHFQNSVAPSGQQVLSPAIHRFAFYFAPVIIFLTWSRGAWIGFLIGVAVFLFLGWRLLKRSQALGLLGIILVFLAIISIGAFELAESLERRVANTNTIYGRLATWTVAIQSGLKAPILGIGLNNLREVLVTNSVQIEGVGNYPRVHNSFLAILAEQGVVGLGVYLGIMASIIRLGLRINRSSSHLRDKWRGITIISIVTAYLIPAMFASTIHMQIPLSHFFLYALCGAVAGRYR